MGDGKYTLSLDTLQSNGKVGKQLKHKINDSIIDLKKQYPKGSEDWKSQQLLKHSFKKEKRLVKKRKELKRLLEKQKTYTKDSKQYIEYNKKVDKQKRSIQQINKSRPKIYGVKTKTLKKVDVSYTKKLAKSMGTIPIPSISKKVGNTVIVFMKADVFKKSPTFKNMKFMNNIKGSHIVMLSIKSGKAVYSVMNGNMSFEELSIMLLQESAQTVGEQVFKKGISLLVAPPVGTVIVVVGTLLIDYSIDKYIELDKRRYIGLEDMLWDVPDEIKNKITILNLEDIKKETIFDFGDIDKDYKINKPKIS